MNIELALVIYPQAGSRAELLEAIVRKNSSTPLFLRPHFVVLGA